MKKINGKSILIVLGMLACTFICNQLSAVQLREAVKDEVTEQLSEQKEES